MTIRAAKFDRRSFIVGTAAASGGLALGFTLPFTGRVARAQTAVPACRRRSKRAIPSGRYLAAVS